MGEPIPGTGRLAGDRWDTQMINSTHVKAHRSASGGKDPIRLLGRSRGGRKRKIHALADAKGRLIAILLTRRPSARLSSRGALDPSS